MNKSDMTQILAPTNCPSCESTLEFVNELLYCFNKMCPAQWDKKLQHFASSLKIKGLGPSTIKKLDLLDYPELYELSVGEITVRLGSEKLATKLHTEIERSKRLDLQTLLPSFAIPLFGRSASQKLCENITSIEEVSEKSCADAGIGPKATANLMAWLETEFYPNRYDETLPFSFKSKKVIKREVIGVVCISGRLKSFPSKAHATEVLENHGYTVKTSLTKDCTHLINESGIESAKTQTARDRGVTIINNLNQFLEEK